MDATTLRRPLRVYLLVLLPVATLVVMGMLAIYATEISGEGKGAPSTIRQGLYLVASLIALIPSIVVPYQKICRYAYVFFVGMLFLLVLVALRKHGVPQLDPIIPDVRGSARWIRLGPVQVQPSEFMKVAFILALAKYLRYRENYRTLVGLMPPFLLTLLPMGLILMQPDLGTVLLMLPVLFAMLYMAGARKLHLLTIIGLSVLAAPLAWQKMKPYQRDRVLVLVEQFAPSEATLLPERSAKGTSTDGQTKPAVPEIRLAWYERIALAITLPSFRQEQIARKRRALNELEEFDPDLLPDPPRISTKTILLFNGRFHPDPNQDERYREWIASKLRDLHHDEGYQLQHSKVALGSGGLGGRGIREGTYIQMEHVLPDRHNDFIYAVIGHVWGFAGCVVVLTLYILIVIGGTEVAIGTKDPFGRLLAVGVISMLAAQVVVNVGMTIGLMPITGMTLPFVSFGGSSLITNFIAVGLLINVAEHRQLLIANRPFEFGREVQEQPASLARWLESRR